MPEHINTLGTAFGMLQFVNGDRFVLYAGDLFGKSLSDAGDILRRGADGDHILPGVAHG